MFWSRKTPYYHKIGMHVKTGTLFQPENNENVVTTRIHFLICLESKRNLRYLFLI